MSELKSMPNIGEEIERKLKSVGISTAEELREIGSKEAFVRLKARHQNVCLVHLYVLHGAIYGEDYNKLDGEVKAELKRFSDSIK